VTTATAGSPPWALAALFGIAGALHFVAPQAYERIVPPWLPFPRALVLASGAAELLGAVGLLVPGWRVAAGWWLILVLAAVFPANVQMLLDGLARPTTPGWGRALLWARLPLQGLLMWWVWVSAVRQR
jgi:uncharacterized membrane protein